MEYSSIVKLTIDGEAFEDYTEFSEAEVELRAAVNLMTKTGITGKTPRRQLMLTAVVPSGRPEKDFEKLKDSVIVAEDEGGQRTTWTGCYSLKVGEAKRDGQNEAKRQIDILVTGDKITE